MKELSLNILDIAQNSIHAEATLVEILLYETEESLKLSIIDNGRGMSEEFLQRSPTRSPPPARRGKSAWGSRF